METARRRAGNASQITGSDQVKTRDPKGLEKHSDPLDCHALIFLSNSSGSRVGGWQLVPLHTTANAVPEPSSRR